MKLIAGKDAFTCALAGDKVVCDPQRARWSNGYWADVCAKHMEIWIKNMQKRRNKWTGEMLTPVSQGEHK